jgi:hypothetical protein
MKTAAALLVLLGLPAVVAAQSGAASQPSSFSGLSPIGLPLAPIGLPLAPIGLPPVVDNRPPASVNPKPPTGERPARPAKPGHVPKHGRGAGVIYWVPAYYGDWSLSGTNTTPPGSGVTVYPPYGTESDGETGLLRLEVRPTGLQVIVDGYFVGTIAEIDSALELLEGTHRIELRAAGYQPMSFDVRITAGRAITYRDELTRTTANRDVEPPSPDATPAPEPAPVSEPTTIYFIPGCYLGNVPPADLPLPPGCDLSRLITRTP